MVRHTINSGPVNRDEESNSLSCNSGKVDLRPSLGLIQSVLSSHSDRQTDPKHVSYKPSQCHLYQQKLVFSNGHPSKYQIVSTLLSLADLVEAARRFQRECI